MIGYEEKMLERWKEYVYDMLKKIPMEPIEEENRAEDPTKDEIEEIIKILEKNKSPGSNGIPPENLDIGENN